MDIRCSTPPRVDVSILGVWISDKRLLAFDVLLLSVWISDKTLLVFDSLLLGVWTSDETLLLLFQILLSVFGYQMKHNSCFTIGYYSPSPVDVLYNLGLPFLLPALLLFISRWQNGCARVERHVLE